MRRLLCATALSGALFVLGACSADKAAETGAGATPATSAPAPGTSGVPTPPGSSPAGGDVALKGNTKAICAQAARTGAEAAQKFAQDLKLLIEAETAQDPSAVAKAKAKTDRDVQNYSSALGDMAKLASEPELKMALTAMGKQVSTLQGDVRKLDAQKLAGLQETLATACGTA
ncbi:hypothetical protein [Couchioplanes caeruleus]|uniref:Small secreted protein n=2 Tax=Couchioplanes caeruleus TaxID=56438 RepID=A0A1K0FFH3_9ACTN|nr:hypothetical protein [Couchioplanes caeruleus]OJF11585.1 hypothetical protein BG844_25390 [Couchioplanes caeruleus subsp. caeruleus]ROP29636.1 hypothetical protein EDD30_2438 [Couchioplanes caeruleus]